MGGLMPPWPAEEFLRSLAVFSESNPEWESAEGILRPRIADRKAAPNTKKYDFLTARDLVTAAVVVWRRIHGRRTVASSSSGPTMTLADQGHVEAQGGSLVVEASLDEATEAAPAVESIQAVYCSSSTEVNPRKRRSARIAENEERKKRFVIECPVINLDVEESVAEMKEAAEGDSEGMKDLELIGRAMRELTEGARVEKEVLIRRLERMLRVAKLELKEVEE